MLVLSRKLGERVVIGDGVVVEVLRVAGNQVRLGFVASKDVPIHREEVFQRVVRERALQMDGKKENVLARSVS